MSIEDLKEGEYYSTIDNFENKSVFISNKLREYKYFVSTGLWKNGSWSGQNIEKNIKLANEQEKHWLNECIKKDKFISYEESQKTFQKPFKFNIGDEIKRKPGGCYICDPEAWDEEKHKHTFPSEKWGGKGKLTERKHCQNLNWYRAGGGNWITEEGIELVSKIEQKSIIPEYVKCVNSWHKEWTTGKIYKVEKHQNEFPEKLTVKSDKNIECDVIDWDIRKGNDSGFKISTEQEYLKQNQPKPVDMKEIQAECEKRFPIGCTFINTEGDEFVLKNDSEVYRIVDDMIYASYDQGCLYCEGKYAELVSLPKEDSKFKVGDYVYHEGNKEFYKITELLNDIRFKAESGYCYNTGNLNLDYCRKALPHEILDYYTISSEWELPKKWCVLSTVGTRDVLFDFIKSKGYNTLATHDWYFHYPFNEAGGSLWGSVQPGYTEITFEQFKEHVLKKKSYTDKISLINIMKPLQEKYNKAMDDYIKTFDGYGKMLKNPVKSQIIPVKIRKNITFETPKRTRLSIIKPQLLNI
jgi:hypothetical protein